MCEYAAQDEIAAPNFHYEDKVKSSRPNLQPT